MSLWKAARWSSVEKIGLCEMKNGDVSVSEISSDLVVSDVALNYPETLMLKASPQNTLWEGHGSFTRWYPVGGLWVISIVPLSEIVELCLFSFSLGLPVT